MVFGYFYMSPLPEMIGVHFNSIGSISSLNVLENSKFRINIGHFGDFYMSSHFPEMVGEQLNGTGSITIHVNVLENSKFHPNIGRFRLFLHVTPSHSTLRDAMRALK